MRRSWPSYAALAVRRAWLSLTEQASRFFAAVQHSTVGFVLLPRPPVACRGRLLGSGCGAPAAPFLV